MYWPHVQCAVSVVSTAHGAPAALGLLHCQIRTSSPFLVSSVPPCRPDPVFLLNPTDMFKSLITASSFTFHSFTPESPPWTGGVEPGFAAKTRKPFSWLLVAQVTPHSYSVPRRVTWHSAYGGCSGTRTDGSSLSTDASAMTKAGGECQSFPRELLP